MGMESIVRADLGGRLAPAKREDGARAVNAFLTGQLSPLTRKAYKTDFQSFLGFLEIAPGVTGEDLIRALSSVTREQATAFRDSLLTTQGKAPATVARRVSVVASIYEVLREEGAIEKSPFFRVKRPRVSREGKTPALTKREAERLLATPDRRMAVGQRDFIMLGLLFYCGLRRHEVVKVRAEDFMQTSGHTVLRVLGKGGRDDVIKVAPALWREVQAYTQAREITGYLFPALSRNQTYNDPRRHLSTTAVAVLYKKYARRAGLDATRLAPHSARATAITLALDGGASIRQVQNFSRHASPETTMRYDRAKTNLDDNAADYLRIRLPEAANTSPASQPSPVDGHDG